LKNFGKYKIAQLEDKEITSDTYIINAIEDLKRDVRFIRNQSLNDKEDIIRRSIRNQNRMTTEISEKEKAFFRKSVQDFIKENNLSLRPKEISIDLPMIITELEKSVELRNIAGDPDTFRLLVEENIY